MGRIERELFGKGGSFSEAGLLACLILVVCIVVLAVHWPVLSCGALTLDDNEYLTENTLVRNPGWKSAGRFLSEVLEPSSVRGYYQPLTMMSLMVDYALGGREDNLRQFHRTSLGLHLANTALVVVFLYLLFGRVWIAAGAGLLFGVHPLTVEPVAWVVERKTLLSAFFSLWCLVFYVRFVGSRDRRIYGVCILAYVLALMSKPTSIMLPVLMLLIDYWPLRRFGKQAVLEKVPLFIVGGIFAVITYVSQSRTAGAAVGGHYGPVRSFFILCHNMVFYLYKIVWPVNLSAYYAYPETLGLSEPTVLAGVVGTFMLIVLLVVSFRWTRGAVVGFLFFFAAIFPTMGVVGFTKVIAADKFVYLPSLGFLMIVVSFLVWLYDTKRIGKAAARQTIIAVVVLLSGCAEAAAVRGYIVHWRDTTSLFEYILTHNPKAAVAHNMLGIELFSQGRFDEAISHYHRALEIRPGDFKTHNNLGNALKAQGKIDEAIRSYRRALEIKEDYAEAHTNLGSALRSKGEIKEAIRHHRRSIELKDEYATAHYNLANALGEAGRLDEAIKSYRRALELKPDYAEAHFNLGNALRSQGEIEGAVSHYRKAIEIKPDYFDAHNNLGIVLSGQGQLEEAVRHFRIVLEHESDNIKVLNNLAAIVQSQGKYGEAIELYRRVLEIEPEYVASLNGLAWILATHPEENMRDGERAVELAERAAELTGHKDVIVLNTLAAAYAEVGQPDKAVTTAQGAMELALEEGKDKLADYIGRQIELYKQARP